jgi:simple sugar transport system permease protein
MRLELARYSKAIVTGNFHIEARQNIERWKHVSIIAASILTGLGISICILIVSGVSVGAIFDEFIVFTFFDRLGLSSVLAQVSPLVLVGLSAIVAFRVNFWNIGIQGQFFWGAVGATVIAIYDVGPAEFRIYLMLIVGALFGALWALPPVLLKLRLGVNEVISTLLLNYVAVYFVLNQIYGAWQDPVSRFPHSERFDPSETMPLIGWESVHAGLILSVVMLFVIWWVFTRTRFGVNAKFVGVNPTMALASGIPVSAVIIASVLFSGALSGMAGYVVASALEYRLTANLAGSYGFTGIVIAFLARNTAPGVMVVAFLTAGLFVGGQSIKIFYGLPPALIGMLLSIVLLSVAGSEFFIRYRLRLVK